MSLKSLFYPKKVYFNYNVGGEVRWIYLGKICNDKPSAIFKITNLKSEPHHPAITFGGAVQHTNAMIGISVEPTLQIDSLTPALSAESEASRVSSYVEFTQKMLENFYNYAASFAKDAPDGQQYFPLITLQNWFENFKRRLELNPNFWRS